jgi:hypothetical protein
MSLCHASTASLTEFRFGSVHPNGHLYEQYAAPFNGGAFDPSTTSHYMPPSAPSGNQLDFLFYADQLLNSFATKNAPGGDVEGFPHSDFLPSAQSLQAMGFGYGGHSDTASSGEDAWGGFGHHGHPAKAQPAMHHASTSAHSALPLPYQQAAYPRQQMLPAIVKRQEWRLCVKAPTLGTFYLFTDPEKTVAEMIPDIEAKIWELYHTFVSVHLVQNDHGIDLPFSCIVSSVVEDRALLCVQYVRTDDVTAAAAFSYAPQAHPAEEASSSAARTPHSSPPSSQAHSPASGSPRSPASDHSSPQSPFLRTLLLTSPPPPHLLSRAHFLSCSPSCPSYRELHFAPALVVG